MFYGKIDRNFGVLMSVDLYHKQGLPFGRLATDGHHKRGGLQWNKFVI